MKELKMNETGKGLLFERDSGFIDPLDDRNKVLLEGLNDIGREGVNIQEPLILTCILQKYGIENANKRVYPEAILKREWNNYQNKIKQKSAFGECNHPSDSVIDLSRIAIHVCDGWWEGQTLFGKIEIIMSPGFIKQGIISCQGDIIANLLRKGYRIGVSSRGLGSVKNEMGRNIVQDDFELVCWDAVADPSTPGAYIFYNDNESMMFKEEKENKNNLLESLDSFLNKNDKKNIII